MICASYNVENLFDTRDDPHTRDNDFTPEGYLDWDKRKLEEKLHNIERAVCAMSGYPPAILGLIEVENYKVVEMLTQQPRMSQVKYKVIHKESNDQRGIDTALIYQPEVVEYVDHEWLSIDDHASAPLYSRDILRARFRHNNHDFHLFLNHWPSQRTGKEETEYKRKAAALTLKESVDLIFEDDPHASIIIMGDFNDTPEDKSLKVYLQAGSSGKGGGTLINLGWDLYRKGLGTIFLNHQWHVMDQFIVSPTLYKHIRGKKMHRLDDDFLMYEDLKGNKRPSRTYSGDRYVGGFSDHLPVWIDLNFQDSVV